MFLGQFLRLPATTGAVAPSSARLAHVDIDYAEEVDVVAVAGRDVRKDLIRHVPALGAQLQHRARIIFRRPRDHGVGQQGQAPRLLGLLLQVRPGDRALLRVVQVAAQRVQALVLVELPRDLPSEGRVRQVFGEVGRAASAAVGALIAWFGARRHHGPLADLRGPHG
nr:hypothetical protein [Nonomuraea sediminis]